MFYKYDALNLLCVQEWCLCACERDGGFKKYNVGMMLKLVKALVVIKNDGLDFVFVDFWSIKTFMHTWSLQDGFWHLRCSIYNFDNHKFQLLV